jgi:hypothetical protein
MSYYITDGNWTSVVNAAGGLNTSKPSFLYNINYSNAADPAVGCARKTFYASYKCGNEKTVRNIPAIIDAVGRGKQANFDCTNLAAKCSNLSLHLGDDGILTIKDSDGKKLWASTSNPFNAKPLLPNVAVALDAYKPRPGNTTFVKPAGMAYNRSYLNSGDYLQLNQYIGSPNGTCRLEMVDISAPVEGTWTTVIPNNAPSTTTFTTGYNNTLLRYGGAMVLAATPTTPAFNTGQWFIKIVPTSGTTFRGGPTLVSSLGATNVFGGSRLQTSSNQGQPWITIGKDGDILTFEANTTIQYGSSGLYVTKTFDVQTTITVEPTVFYDASGVPNIISSAANNSVQIQMFPSSPSGRSLQVVYNVLGCSSLLPIDKDSSDLYTIPWTNRENLGKMGYINESGQLRTYVDPNLTPGYSSDFTLLSNADNTTYGMAGMTDFNLPDGTFTGVTDAETCKRKCATYGTDPVTNAPVSGAVNCVGFEYEKISGTCKLKSEGIISGGIRYNNPTDGSKNYQYYSRMKNISGLDASCPSNSSDIMSKTTDDWNGFTLDTIKPHMDGDVKCGLLNRVNTQRIAVEAANTNLNTFTGPFASTINNLYAKYQALKDTLTTTQTNLGSSLNELNDTKQNLADWSGEQLAQLEAMDEDRQLNMTSQNIKYILWSILAILAVITIIKLSKYIGGTKTGESIVKSLDIPSPLATQT